MKMSKSYSQEIASFATAIEKLKGKKVAVCSHVRPDGDCIGSTVAMVRILNNLGAEAVGINQDEIPPNLKGFVGDTPLLSANDFQPEGHVAVTVDCADKKRIGKQETKSAFGF